MDFFWINLGAGLAKCYSASAHMELDMAEVRLQIPDEVISALQEKLGINMKVTDIAKDAVTLFNWAVGERAKGNLILSSDEDGNKMTRLAMPSIERAAPIK